MHWPQRHCCTFVAVAVAAVVCVVSAAAAAAAAVFEVQFLRMLM